MASKWAHSFSHLCFAFRRSSQSIWGVTRMLKKSVFNMGCFNLVTISSFLCRILDHLIAAISLGHGEPLLPPFQHCLAQQIYAFFHHIVHALKAVLAHHETDTGVGARTRAAEAHDLLFIQGDYFAIFCDFHLSFLRGILSELFF